MTPNILLEVINLTICNLILLIVNASSHIDLISTNSHSKHSSRTLHILLRLSLRQLYVNLESVSARISNLLSPLHSVDTLICHHSVLLLESSDTKYSLLS